MRRIVVFMLAGGLLAGCGGEATPETPETPRVSEGATHIHGVGIDPADDSLYVATHTGLFTAPEGEPEVTRVGESHQDTMGFTIVGPREFLGSGHPDAREELPPLLGLIRSRDAGRTWTPVSLLGEADFHVLRASGDHVYGFDATQGRLMVSTDGGRTWKERRPPAGMFDLAIDPKDPEAVIASTQEGLASSEDGGRRWRPLTGDRAGLLVWLDDGLLLVDGAGEVHRSKDRGRSWQQVGQAGGQPAALSAHEGTVLVGLHTNEVKESTDGGRTWTPRATV